MDIVKGNLIRLLSINIELSRGGKPLSQVGRKVLVVKHLNQKPFNKSLIYLKTLSNNSERFCHTKKAKKAKKVKKVKKAKKVNMTSKITERL
jgi:hypothetical protein